MPQVKSEMPGRGEPVINSRRGDTSGEPLPGESARIGAPPTQDPTVSLSISQAAAMLAKRRHDRQAPPAVPAAQAPAVVQSTIPESEQPEEDSEQREPDVDDLSTEELEDLPESEEELEDELTAEQSEESEEDAAPQTLTIAGQEMTLDEVEEGFLRQDDYTRKTQHLAERVQEAGKLEEEYATRIGQIDGMLRSELAAYENLDWEGIAAQSLQQHAVVSARYNKAKQKFEAHQRQVDQFFSQVEERKTAERTRQIQEATDTLSRVFKGNWNDARYYDLIEFMSKGYGASREDLLKETNPLLFRLAAEAQANRNATRVTPKPKVKRTGRRVPNSRRTTTEGSQGVTRQRSTRKAEDAYKTLEKAGTVDAAAAAYAARRQNRKR